MMQITRNQRRLLVTLVATAAGGLMGFVPAMVAATLAFAVFTIADNVAAIWNARRDGPEEVDHLGVEPTKWNRELRERLTTDPAHKDIAGNIWSDRFDGTRD